VGEKNTSFTLPVRTITKITKKKQKKQNNQKNQNNQKLTHGATGAVTPAIPLRAFGRMSTSMDSPSGMTPLAWSLSTHPMYSAASVAGMPIFCATTL